MECKYLSSDHISGLKVNIDGIKIVNMKVILIGIDFRVPHSLRTFKTNESNGNDDTG